MSNENDPSAETAQEASEKVEELKKARQELENFQIETIEDKDAEKILEKVEVHGDDFMGEFLTPEVLKEEGLLPKHKIRIGDSVVWFSSSGYELDGGRVAVVAYVEKEGKVTARSYYRSNSQGVWRYLPDYTMSGDGEINWYGKGHSEESITLPVVMQKALSEITREDIPVLKLKKNPDFIFAGTAQKVGKVGGEYYREIEASPRRLEGEFYAEQGKTPPEQIRLSPEQSPDFSKLLTSWVQNTSVYGQVAVEVFPSKDGELKFMFCKDADGRVWIGGVEDNSETQSTGLKKSWIEGGDLATPAYEYKIGGTDQTGGYGNERNRNGPYVDMYENYLRKIPVIQEYLNASVAHQIDETPTPPETTESTTSLAVAPPPEPQPDNTPPEPPTPPTPPEPPTPPTDDGRRLLAEKEAENIIKAMEEEEKNRLIERALDRAGFFGSLLFRKRITEKVAGGGEYRVPENVRQTIQEYTLSKALDRNITASGGEVRRLMEQFGYELDEMGGFRPPHPDSNTSWLGRLLRPNRAKTTGATFLGGMALGHVARNAMAGVLGAVGGGALAGGLFGFLRGKREAAEATTSGESWTRELDAALNSQNEAAIEIACHKVERIFTDDNARNEFFRDRTRMEASKILERYREGIRRLSLNRMANEVEGNYPTEQARDIAVAERYALFCGKMAEGEEQFMRAYGATYENALNQELRIIRVEPPEDELSDIEQRMREQVEIGYNRDTNERRRVRRGIVARSAIRGALIGGIAGGIGWYVGNLLSNLSGGGGEAAGVGTGEKASGVVAGGNETQQQWGLFSNENYMREQGFTVERAAPEFGHILEHQDCPVQVFDGVAYAGTDQGAALREAVLTWQDKLDFGGMDKVHIANLMNFAGDPSIAPGVDAGSYHISLEQVQAVIDHIKGAGDIGILSANEVMAEAGIREVASAIAASPVAEAGQEAAKTMWPGWPLIAGAAGFAGGYGVDNARRRAEIAGTNATAAGPIAPPSGGASGRLAPIAPRPPEPEPQLPLRPTSTEPETPPAPEQGSTENANAANQERITALRNDLEIEGLYETEGLTTAIRQIDITLSRSPFNSKALRIELLSGEITKKMTDNNFTDSTLSAVPEQVREQALRETSERLLRTYDELQSLEQGANT